MNHRHDPPPLGFDEQRALENLQNLHREIQRVRRERERAEAEFDAFLRRCREGERVPDAKPAAPPPRPASAVVDTVPETPPDAEPEPGPAEGDSFASTEPVPRASPDAEPVASEPRGEPPRPLVAPAPRRKVGRAMIPIAALALVATIVAVRARRDTPVPPDTGRAAAVPATADDAAADATSSGAPGAAESPAVAAPEGGVNLEIVTRRPVWVRVTVDGRRAIERELAADQRIPLRADRSIVIRAGDAGAIAVRRQGRDEATLGPDGVVTTREFFVEESGTPVR